MIKENKEDLKNQNSKGFSLVELLAVTLIIGMLSGFLIFNFKTSASNQAVLQRGALTIVAALRQAQTLSINSSRFKGEIPCGYGLHYKTATLAVVYFGSRPNPTDLCSTQSRNFNNPPDKEFNNVIFTDTNLEFSGSFPDVFFEPPDPRTYINNNSSLDISPLSIVIRFLGANCSSSPTSCKTILVYTSGRIDVQ